MFYPAPLLEGSVIAITAFSAGINTALESRYQHVIKGLKDRGFTVIEGNCLRGKRQYVSAPAELRAAELMTFLLDDTIDAVAAPYGGELAMEVLPLLDFERLKTAKPKWLFGFSDISTITCVLSSRLHWATAHSANLIDLAPNDTDPLTRNCLTHLGTRTGQRFDQSSSQAYSYQWPDIVVNPKAVLAPTQVTQWQWLVAPEQGHSVEGRLIGGCWDTLIHLFATDYLDLKAFSDQFEEGTLLYLENVEMNPADLVRAILSMKFRGVFHHLDALLLGRSAYVETPNDQLSYYDVLSRHLTHLGIPVLMDMDIGHVPPNLILINGALAKVECEHGRGKVTQLLV